MFVSRLRVHMLLLEAFLIIDFCACIRMIIDEVFISDFFLWQREDVSWEPACSHLSLSEGVYTHLKLTQEELTIAAAARAQRNRERTQRCRERQRQLHKAVFSSRKCNPVRRARIVTLIIGQTTSFNPFETRIAPEDIPYSGRNF